MVAYGLAWRDSSPAAGAVGVVGQGHVAGCLGCRGMKASAGARGFACRYLPKPARHLAPRLASGGHQARLHPRACAVHSPSIRGYARAMPDQTKPRHFPPPWSIAEYNDACFIVSDHNGQALAYVYFEDEPGRRSAANLLTRDEARRIAANIVRATCRFVVGNQTTLIATS